jgi:hypothetical protein
MRVKKILQSATFLLFLAVSVPVNAAETEPVSSPAKTENPRAQQLLQRLEDIKDMDKSGLTRLEKKDLRKEVKGIRKEMKAIKGGVYLSVGAVIIIILLLILIL